MSVSSLFKIKRGGQIVPLPTEGDDVGWKDHQQKQIGDINELGKMSVGQLKDMLQRQEKIIQNRVLLSKLSDKGERLKRRYSEIKRFLSLAENTDSKDKEESNFDHIAYEWGKNGIVEPSKTSVPCHSNELDSDDEPDPLVLMANHSSIMPRHTANYESTNSTEDVLANFNKMSLHDATNSCTETKANSKNVAKSKKESFKPFRTRHSQDTFSPSSKDSKSILLPIKDSLALQKTYHEREKEHQLEIARTKLSTFKHIRMQMPTTTTLQYREKEEGS